MATGLLALLDDIATVADDVSTLTLAATKKTTGIVTDDMAVTAEQTLGLARERELPVVWKVALGSLRNKALFLVPGALLLNAVAPWSLRWLLMGGGAFLCFEGVEKILHRFLPHGPDEAHGTEKGPVDLVAYEKQRVAGAIRTDLILSAEIIAISLGEVAKAAFWTQVLALYAISLVMTVGVYGLVAGLVKLDDAGDALVKRGASTERLGKIILVATPYLMKTISWVGTIAMLLVGGHLLVHGIPPLEHAIHDVVHGVAHGAGWLETIGTTLADFLVGAVAGLAVVGVVVSGVFQRLYRLLRRSRESEPG